MHKIVKSSRKVKVKDAIYTKGTVVYEVIVNDKFMRSFYESDYYDDGACNARNEYANGIILGLELAGAEYTLDNE